MRETMTVLFGLLMGQDISQNDAALLAKHAQKSNEKAAAIYRDLQKAAEDAKRKGMVAGFVSAFKKADRNRSLVTLVYFDTQKKLISKQLVATTKTETSGKLTEGAIIHVKTAGVNLRKIEVVKEAEEAKEENKNPAQK